MSNYNKVQMKTHKNRYATEWLHGELLKVMPKEYLDYFHSLVLTAVEIEKRNYQTIFDDGVYEGTRDRERPLNGHEYTEINYEYAIFGEHPIIGTMLICNKCRKFIKHLSEMSQFEKDAMNGKQKMLRQYCKECQS
jgi:hypothetical protein